MRRYHGCYCVKGTLFDANVVGWVERQVERESGGFLVGNVGRAVEELGGV